MFWIHHSIRKCKYVDTTLFTGISYRGLDLNMTPSFRSGRAETCHVQKVFGLHATYRHKRFITPLRMSYGLRKINMLIPYSSSRWARVKSIFFPDRQFCLVFLFRSHHHIIYNHRTRRSKVRNSSSGAHAFALDFSIRRYLWLGWTSSSKPPTLTIRSAIQIRHFYSSSIIPLFSLASPCCSWK